MFCQKGLGNLKGHFKIEKFNKTCMSITRSSVMFPNAVSILLGILQKIKKLHLGTYRYTQRGAATP